MPLALCRECEKQVSTEASTCPNCGAPRPTASRPAAGPDNATAEIHRSGVRPADRDTGEPTWSVFATCPAGLNQDSLRVILSTSASHLGQTDVESLLSQKEASIGSGLSVEQANALMIRLHEAGIPSRKSLEVNPASARSRRLSTQPSPEALLVAPEIREFTDDIENSAQQRAAPSEGVTGTPVGLRDKKTGQGAVTAEGLLSSSKAVLGCLGLLGVLGITMIVMSVITGHDSGGNELTKAYVDCEFAARGYLKSPSTARFPATFDSHVVNAQNSSLKIFSHVDAQNSFGAMLQTRFFCEMKRDGRDWKTTNVVFDR